MSGSVNKVTLIGNLCADPEARAMQSGGEVVSFRLATNESWTDKQSGEKREKAEYHSVVIFNEGLAKVAKQYLRKGSSVYIEGQLQTRKWQDQSGNDRYSTEICLQKFRGELVLLGGKGERQTGSAAPAPQYDSDLDDSVPFASNAWHLESRVS